MKTSKTNLTSCKPFALIAALASLLLCSCASQSLLEREHVLKKEARIARDHGDEERSDSAHERLSDVQDQIDRERVENMHTARQVLGSVLQFAPMIGNAATERSVHSAAAIGSRSSAGSSHHR